MVDVACITLEKNGVTIDVATERVVESITKKLVNITPAQSTANWANGPKDTKIVDLLRIEQRYDVSGSIASADKQALKNMVLAGGVISMDWDGETDILINVDKLDVTKSADSENDERPVRFTAIKGVNI
jgi:hypothetical protein